jgi:FkbM family methyltransferase
MKESKYLDYLGIDNKNVFRNKIKEFLNNKSLDFFPMCIIKKMLIFLLYLPKKLLDNHRKNVFIKFYRKHSPEVKKLLDILGDETSKETIISQINYFSTFDGVSEIDFLHKHNLYEKHLKLLDNNEYFPEGIIHLSENEVLVDCGGFTGDTIESFVHKTNNKFSHIFSFEIDKINFEKLIQTTKKLGISSDKISCYLKGVYSRDKKLTVDFKGIGSSLSTDSNGNDVDVVSLDSFMSEDVKNKITYIKMDIEGTELEGLKGAQEIIKKYKPKLAICIYHRPSDFWEIPFYIRSLRPDYKLYIRQHSISRTGTICYAI